VVGIPQTLHFKQVFAILELMGYEWSRDCVHVGFGTVKFADRQMATREGEVIFLEEVLAEAVKRAAGMMDETRGVENPEEVAEMVGIGAVVYTFLKNNRERDIIFSWEDMLDLEGDSGPYAQYTCARAGSVLRKAVRGNDNSHSAAVAPSEGDDGDAVPYNNTNAINYLSDAVKTADFGLLVTGEEFELLSLLNGFGNAVKEAAYRYEPSLLTRQVAQTARAFNKFYNSCKILGAEPGLKEARLALCLSSMTVLRKGLELLGIKSPEQM
jgi:arginyl-tRNA synthetase